MPGRSAGMIFPAVASIAAVLVSIVNSTSTLAASSAAVSATGKPSASAFSRVRFHTVTE